MVGAKLSAYPLLTERSRVSLLTESEGEEAYALWGHTAIRVSDDSLQVDDVFNYGIFDFSGSNFVWRFALGETDYILGAYSMNQVYINCIGRNLGLVEQTLNLDLSERQRLWESLLENARLENRVYRYNFLFDNCSTRPLAMIERSLNGAIVFQDTLATAGTFRQMIHQTTLNAPWIRFGIDLALGSPLDRPVTFREEFFLPVYLMQAFDRATIGGAEGRKLVSKREQLVERDADDEEDEEFPIPKPMVIISLFAIVWLFVTRVAYFEERPMRLWVDALFYLPYGVIGVIIAFLMFISTHPTTFPNWQILVYNPIQLLYVVALIFPAFRSRLGWFHRFNLGLFLLFVASYPFVQQVYPPETLLLAFISGVRSFVWIKKGGFSWLK